MYSENEIVISNASEEDTDALHEIETLSFPAGMAASREAFVYRLKNYPEWFYKAEVKGKIVGYTDGCPSENMYITDDLYQADGSFNKNGTNLLIFGLAVHPDYRHNGIAHMLLRHILSAAKAEQKKRVSLTCKERLTGFYESFGFRNHGVSESFLCGIKCYDMEIDL